MNKKPKKQKSAVLERNRPISYIMLAPWLILFIILGLIPVIASILLSFTSFDLLNIPKFNGLSNYVRLLLDDDIFRIALKNTLIMAIVTGPLGYLLNFVFAWGINESKTNVRTILTLLFYTPSLGGSLLFIFQLIFSGDSYGLLNGFLLEYGLIDSPIQWLSNSDYCFTIVIIVSLWMSCGTGFLTFLAGLQALNRELSEAGAIDGIRNRWQELWYITLPGMRNMLFFSAVMQIASAFSISNIVTTLAGYPTVGYAADTVVSYLTDIGSVRYEMGYASALSVVLFIVMFATRGITVKLLKKVGQ